MDRIRAVVYGGLVSLGVFAYLALPLLQELYGQVVVLPVFAGIALLAGAVTYGIVRRIQEYATASEERTAGENEVVIDGEVYEVRPDDRGDGEGEDDGDGDGDRGPDVDVEVEMEQLRDDAGGRRGPRNAGGSASREPGGDATSDED